MAKSKKSKILAMALCASVMTGIYASPVMAADVNANFDSDSGNIVFTIAGDTCKINKDDITKAIEKNHIHSNGRISANAGFIANGGSYYAIRGTNNQYTMLANEKYFALGSGGLLKGPEGSDNYNTTKERATFYVDNATGNVTTKGDVTTLNYSLNTIGANTAGIERIQNGAGNNITEIENTLRIYDNGTISTVNGAFRINKQGNVFANAVNVADGAVVISEKSINAFENKFIVNKNGGVSTTGINVVKGMFTASADGVTMARGNMKVDTAGNIILADERTVDGVDVSKLKADFDETNGNVGGISREGYENAAYGEGRTEIEDLLAVNGVEGKVSVMGKDGTVAVITKDGTARFGVETGKNLRWKNGELAINSSGEDAVAKLSEKGLMLTDANGAQTLTAAKIADIKEITRTGAPEYGYTTSIEGSFRVKSDGSFGTDNDTFVVNDLGEISAANGEFFVDRYGAVTAQADSVIGDVRFSGGGDLNNVNHINGALIEAYDADPDNGVSGLRISGVAMENGAIKVNAINGATVNYYGEGGLEISGVGMLNGNVSAQTFNGVSIEKDTDGSAVIGGIDIGNLNENVAAVTENIAGIERIDKDGDGTKETTTIEGRLVVNKEELVIGGYGEGNSLTIKADGARFAGNVVFNNGYDVSFSYGENGSKGTSLGKLAEGFDNLNAKVDDIYDRTQGISRDEDGNTVISNDERTWNEETGTSEVTDNDGATVTVGEDVTIDGGNLNVNNGDLNVGTSGEGGSGSGEGGSTGGNGGNGNFSSDINVGGNANVNGTVTVGDASDGKYTQVGESGMTVVGKDENNNTTTNNISDKGMTVTGENGTNNISDSGMTITGKDGNTTNNISDKGMTVTGSNGTTDISGGDISVDNSVTVAGGSENKTTINNEGITVGDKGTSIKNDSISVGDGGYIGDGDVRSGEGVSLNQTAERVGHLENRVGELEDRIDKVGAMAAAIANLRTMGYDPAAPTEVAVGIGQYRDETGAALGLFHYPNRDFMLSLSVSTSGDEVMGGIGATWKFGRKSPEKVAEIKKAQAEADARRAEEAKLAKAEEMKQAAKEAKIKAQQERHAKLAAERAAQAEVAK